MTIGLLASAAIAPGTLAAQETRQFGAVTYDAPAGWSLDSQPRVQVFTRIQGQDRCMLIVTLEESSPPGLSAAFAAAWRGIFSTGYRRAEQPASVERVAPAGFRYAVGEGSLEDGAGRQLVARLHVIPLGATSQWIVLIGSTPQALASCGPEWEAFFRSLRLRSTTAGTPAPGRAAATPPVADAGVAASGEPGRFENLIFVPPHGWMVRRTNNLVQLTATGTRGPEQLDVFLLPGRVTSASLDREMEATWGEVQSLLGAQLLRNVSGQVYDLDEPGRSLAGVEYLRGNGGMRAAGGDWDVSVYLFRAADRIERAAVISRAFTENLARLSTANSLRFSQDIRRLLFGMKFGNVAGRAPARAGLNPGGIVGVWAGLGMSFGSIKTQFAVFFDNGLAYFGPGLPLEGLHDVDPVAEQPAHRRDWGSYSWDGNAGSLVMPYGTIPLRSTGPALELTTNRTPHRYIKLGLPVSLRLDGTWCYGDGPCVTFTPDGKFEDSGAIRAAEHSTYAWPQSPAGGAGRYTLRDHTLHLAYDGGPELRVAFPGVEDGRTSSPSTLRLGWNADLLRRR